MLQSLAESRGSSAVFGTSSTAEVTRGNGGLGMFFTPNASASSSNCTQQAGHFLDCCNKPEKKGNQMTPISTILQSKEEQSNRNTDVAVAGLCTEGNSTHFRFAQVEVDRAT